MKKILYINFNVGSAIEYSGDTFKLWIEEVLQTTQDVEFLEIKDQDQSFNLFKKIFEYKPDVILLNEHYQKSMEATLYYKQLFPNTKVFQFLYVWKDLNVLLKDEKTVSEQHGLYDIIKFKFFFRSMINYMFVLNYKIDGNFDSYGNLAHRIENYTCPTDPAIWNNKIEWKKREKNFVYIGNILPHKMSPEFIDKISKTDITIDCYGKLEWTNKIYKNYDEYVDKVKNTPNLIIKGLYPQSEIPTILNNYRYFILPHNGDEPFNWSVLQSIYSGTIPLIVNDVTSTKFDTKWIDWADGLYMGMTTVDDLIYNLNVIESNSPDFTHISNIISNNAINKFDYNKMKESFKNKLLSFIG